MLATQHSMENSLRWLRRLIVIILIVANLMTVMLADAATSVTEQHITAIQYSGIQTGIYDPAVHITGRGTVATTQQLSITIR
jgi:hypothetical protein